MSNSSKEPRRAPLDAQLDLISTEPGVYLMKDASGSVIYVGKANNLRQRLRSYFCPNPVGDAKFLALIANIADFETILVRMSWKRLFSNRISSSSTTQNTMF